MENGKSRLQKTQEDVEEVKEIMLDNLKKAEVRGDKLTDLEDRADVLLQKSKTFRKTCRRLRVKKRGDNKKMKKILIGIGVTVPIVIIIITIVYFVLQRQ